MEKLWVVQKNKDGTYGNWKKFKENKEGIIIVEDKTYKYVYGRDAENKGSIISKEVKKVKILILEGLHGNNKSKKMQWRLKHTNLKVGDRVVLNCHDWKVVKVIEQKKKRKIFWDYGIPTYEDWAGNIDTLKGIKYVIEQVNKRKLAELRNRPYFKTIVTGVKGKPRGENLEKIKFPCWCSYFDCGDKRRYGEIDLVFFNGNKRFRLRELRQSKLAEVIYCVYHRDSLESLIEDYDIEILKGELHLWREVK